MILTVLHILLNWGGYKDTALVSISADYEEIFGENGIYSTGSEYDEWYINGQEGEMPDPNFMVRGKECLSHVYFYIPDGNDFEQDAGVRIRSHSHRDERIKQFSLYSREKFSGNYFFNVELFEGSKTHSIALRQGFMNAFAMYIASDRDIAVQRCIPANVFLNGEFWYSAYIQEKYNESFFEQRYGLESVEYYKKGITDDIIKFLNTYDMSDEFAYDKLDKIMDIQSYIDFSCVNVYLSNCDYSEDSNAVIWRSNKIEDNKYGDGRWRWGLYDMDLVNDGFRGENDIWDTVTNAQLDSFNVMRYWAPTVHEQLLFSNLKKSDKFRRNYVITFMDLVNTDFEVSRMEQLLEEWGENIEYDDYFFRERQNYILDYLADEFELNGTLKSISISINDNEMGHIEINTISPKLINNKWTGKYFTDYPIEIRAVPNEGYKFVEWSGAVDSKEIDIMWDLSDGGTDINATFAKK